MSGMELTRPDGSPLRVLVVDDEVNIAELVSMALRYEGWQVAAAHTGSKAVSTAKDFRPDAVVLDVMLPDFDGLEVLRQLRAAPETAATPVIALSANAMPADIQRALAAGLADYWTKPLDFKVFTARLEQQFGPAPPPR